jgi:F0F1-type ATP synthase membrane subunit a
MSYMSDIFYFIGAIYQHVNSTLRQNAQEINKQTNLSPFFFLLFVFCVSFQFNDGFSLL